ncbi:MAG: [FeFe] hydrogenase H-cluster radical SAM maturase HydE [Planctomycetota bacterium]|jgi:biotin synthase
MLNQDISVEEIEAWLRETDEQKLETLWAAADAVRTENVGDEVHLRGLIEASNFCVRQCAYCGLAADNKNMSRYRMNADEIYACAEEAASYGYGTVVMQAGEDYGIKSQWLADIVKRIKNNLPLAVTLSMGERPLEDLKLWRDAGANRYLLRFETSDSELYKLIHPPLPKQTIDRFDILDQLKELGFETGSGVMIGIPGQTFTTLANDIDTFRRYDMDMVGVGPYIPNPQSPLEQDGIDYKIAAEDQVENTEMMTYKVVALTRIVCPEANIPSTTALATINKKSGRELGLSRGANVVMPNVTPVEYRTQYEIYPGKACLNETAKQCQGCLAARIASIGRTIGKGQGSRKGKE